MSPSRRHVLAALLIAFFAASAIGCAPKTQAPAPQQAAAPDRAPDRSAERAVLVAQALAWDQAIVAKDAAAIADNMAEDFWQIRSDGVLIDKAAFLRDILAPELVIEPYAVEDQEVRFFGDAALLSGHSHMKGSYQGEAFATHYRYSDVYARRGGRWQVVSVQLTTIPEKKTG